MTVVNRTWAVRVCQDDGHMLEYESDRRFHKYKRNRFKYEESMWVPVSWEMEWPFFEPQPPLR